MKAGVCLFFESFSFCQGEKTLLEQLDHLKKLMVRMNSDFIAFFKSDEYDEKLAATLFSPSSDMGGIMSQFYDMGKVTKVPYSCNELLDIINSDTPVYNHRLMWMYNSTNNNIITNDRKLTILNENELVKNCREILDLYPRDYIEYGNNIKDIFRNLIFLENNDHPKFKSFNSMNKLVGGFNNFVRGITDFLFFANSYDIIPQDSHSNIKKMSVSLKYVLCEEGGKKSERKPGELNRDFKIEGKIYKDVNCEFHYKLSYKDGQYNKGTYYNDNRIYFGFFNKIKDQKPKIAIAHIGEHL